MSADTAPREMALARPWDTADDHSLWEVTGRSPDGQFFFARCLAMAVVDPVRVDGEPAARAFLLVPEGDLIPPEFITSARPLLLVYRDDSTRQRDAR